MDITAEDIDHCEKHQVNYVIGEECHLCKPRFEATFCSNCGKEFGPGNHGFSHCESHAHLTEAE